MDCQPLAYINHSLPPWANDQLSFWDHEDFREKEAFIVDHYWTGQGSVNVFNIVGTQHSDYANRSWLHLLKHGKRMRSNQALLETNPVYYLNNEQKLPPMHFLTTDGMNFYVGGDGNHRSCLARFFFYDKTLTHLHGISIDHYKMDEVFFGLYQQIIKEIDEQRLTVRVTPGRETLGRDDTAGWKTDHFQPYLTWQENGQATRLGYTEARQKYEYLLKRKSSLWHRLFG